MTKYEKLKLVAPWSKAMLHTCEVVTDIDEEVRGFLPYLIRILRNEDGIGISANQVGISKRVFVTNVPGDYIHIFINPELEMIGGGDIETREGCLSFMDKQIVTQRKRHAIIHALNLKGEPFTIDTRDRIYSAKTSALLSVCIQHECDHIYGIDLRPYI